MPKKQVKKKQKGEGAYDWVANNVFGAKLSPGEVHAPQYTSKGFRFGAYIGPGTDVYGGINKGAVPVSATDKVAKMHDINYTLSETVEDVRAADKRMINKLNQLRKEKGDYKFNIYMGKLPIATKNILEDWGIIRKGAFSSMDGKTLTPENRATLEKAKEELTQEGYGKKKKAKGASPWLTHVKAYAKNNNCSYKEAMTKARDRYKK